LLIDPYDIGTISVNAAPIVLIKVKEH